MNFFLITGLGSIGKRHLNNLIGLGHENIILVARSGNIDEAFSRFPLYTNLQQALSENKVSHAFICTPTAHHVSDLEILLAHNIPNIYLEKPISHNLDKLHEIGKLASGCKRFVVGYDLHFDPGLGKVKDVLAKGQMGKVFSINAAVGQFLPDWRPHENHRDGMSAKVVKGGGVMLDLIHEFDYVRWLAGKPVIIGGIFQNNPKLEIETEDVADVLIKFEGNTAATIHLDYHQKNLVRNCMITCENGSVFWDLAQSEVRIAAHGKEPETFSYIGFERNQRYVAIVKAFLDESQFDPRLTTYKEALVSLKMVVAAKESSETQRFISIN